VSQISPAEQAKQMDKQVDKKQERKSPDFEEVSKRNQKSVNKLQ
jgi:hypothetical protein